MKNNRNYLADSPIFQVFQEYLSSIDWILLLNSGKCFRKEKELLIYYSLNKKHTLQFLQDEEYRNQVKQLVKDSTKQISLMLNGIYLKEGVTEIEEIWKVHKIAWHLHNLEDLSFLKYVRGLDFSNSPTSMPTLSTLMNIEELDLSYCYTLTAAIIESLGNLPRLKKLYLRYISSMNDQALKALHKIPNLNINGCKGITDISCLNANYQQSISLAELTAVNNFQSLQNILKINVSYCIQITNQDLQYFQKCQELLLFECSLISDLSSLTSLTSFAISSAIHLISIEPLRFLLSLKKVYFGKCENILDFSPIGHVPSLTIEDCQQVTDLSFLSHGVRELDLSGCIHLQDLTPITSIRSIKKIDLRRCHSLIDVNPLKFIPQINLVACEQVSIFNELGNYQDSLDLSGISSIIEVNHLSKVKKFLNLARNSHLQNIDALTEIEVLNISYCNQLQDITEFLKHSHNKKIYNHGNPKLIGSILMKVIAGEIAMEVLDRIIPSPRPYLQSFQQTVLGPPIPSIAPSLLPHPPHPLPPPVPQQQQLAPHHPPAQIAPPAAPGQPAAPPAGTGLHFLPHF